MIKKARTYKIKEFENFQLEVGVINKENPKSIYFNLKGHLNSIDTNDRQNIRKFLKSIENTVERNIDKVLFVEEQSKSGSLSEVLAFEFASRGLLLNLKTVHLPSFYIFENGNQEQILDSIGFSSSDLLKQIESLMF